MTEHDLQVIFLTATVAPKSGTHLLARTDADARRRDYLEAFRFYVDVVRRHPEYRLVMVENSGADLGDFVEMARAAGIAAQTECISYEATEDPTLNRLYLEGALILEGLRRSTMMNLPDVTIWKVTGRYIITNIERLIAKRPAAFDMYLNSRKYPSPWVDFYVAGFSRRGLEASIARIWDRLLVRDTGEQILQRAIEEDVFSDLKVLMRLKVVPFIKGRRGYDNRRYDGVTQVAKYWVRVAVNAVAPRLWI